MHLLCVFFVIVLARKVNKKHSKLLKVALNCSHEGRDGGIYFVHQIYTYVWMRHSFQCIQYKPQNKCRGFCLKDHHNYILLAMVLYKTYLTNPEIKEDLRRSKSRQSIYLSIYLFMTHTYM